MDPTRIKMTSPLAHQRTKVLNYHEDGFNAKQIIQITRIPKTTVYRILNKIKDGTGLARKTGSGRPRKLRGSDLIRAVKLALSHPKWSAERVAREMEERGSPKVHRDTITRTLKRQGIIKWIPRRIPNLDATKKANRVDWCKAHLGTDWSRVVFTDETYVRLIRDKIKEWGAVRPAKSTPKWTKAIMVWGGLSSLGPTPLFMDCGRVDSAKYQKILDTACLPFMEEHFPDGWTLQQDGATCHTSRDTKK